jgi:formylmethanofuran dehydrogenase subunit B
MLKLASFVMLASIVGACGASEDDAKLIAVDNQTEAAHTVLVGDADFGTVSANTTSTSLEVDDGALNVMIDGAFARSLELASDNVGGSWTLVLQDDPQGDLAVGIVADE